MVEIKEYTTKVPLQMIGDLAGVCWEADTSDSMKNIKRAWDCIESGHDRTEEFPDVYMVITGYSAKCLRELYTHIGGAPTRLQASTRYIDYAKGFETLTPPTIAKDEKAFKVWEKTVKEISKGMNKLKELGIPKEDYTELLPLSYRSKMVWKVNLRTLVHFMQKRKCTRAYWEIRVLCDELSCALIQYSSEWEAIVRDLFVPECEALGYCRESKSCGRKPKKEDIIKTKD